MNDYIKLINSWPKKWRARKILKYPEILYFLDEKFPKVSLPLQIHALLTGDSPYCVVCNKPVKFQGKKTCSLKCRDANINQAMRVAKQKETLITKYKVDNIRKIVGAEEKRKNTLKQKYNSLVSPLTRQKTKERVSQLNEKGKKTLFKKYGVTNPSQLNDHGKKCKSTLLRNYGVDNYFKSEIFLKKSENNHKLKYDSYCPSTIKIISIEESNKQEYENPNKIISFICLSCNSTESLPSETFKWRIRNTNTSCQKCSNINKGSLQEQEIKDFLIDELCLDIKNNQRILSENKEIDILIPNFNLGIEYNGLFWHNDLRISKTYHKKKQDEAKKLGIALIHIFEDEWLHKKEIVKSRIKNQVRLSSTKIFARKCTLKEITTQEEKEFLEKNHLQGYTKSSVKLGLFYKENLVSVMTFSKPNKAKGQKKEEGFWELLRFCSIINANVIGGASKLFSYFVKKYEPNKILSFSDNRWSENGKLYEKLNFKFIKNTSINYWYIDLKNTKRIHRFLMRKNKTDDINLSEYDNRLKQGFLRIWDCGSAKWMWTKGNAEN